MTPGIPLIYQVSRVKPTFTVTCQSAILLFSRWPRTSATSNHLISRIVLAARAIALFTASPMPFEEEPTSSIPSSQTRGRRAPPVYRGAGKPQWVAPRCRAPADEVRVSAFASARRAPRAGSTPWGNASGCGRTPPLVPARQLRQAREERQFLAPSIREHCHLPSGCD